jgi:predicted 2-oxoglutarate/Fe(II)-dependent dioxygenase YbiX
MKGEWCYFKSYFDKETCEQLIETAKMLPTQNARVGTNDNPIEDNASRRSKVSFIMANDWRFRKLFDDLWRTAIEANNDFFNVHLSKLEYKEHHDVFWLNEDPFYHRKLSCVIQLSDPRDYEGGRFEITEASIPPDPEELIDQGTVIFFPSFLRHKANPVTKGTRYSIAAWFEGPKWR